MLLVSSSSQLNLLGRDAESMCTVQSKFRHKIQLSEPVPKTECHLGEKGAVTYGKCSGVVKCGPGKHCPNVHLLKSRPQSFLSNVPGTEGGSGAQAPSLLVMSSALPSIPPQDAAVLQVRGHRTDGTED